MGRSSWVYSLRREALIQVSMEFGLKASGTVEELRKELVVFINQPDQKESVIARLEELEQQYSRAASPLPQGAGGGAPSATDGAGGQNLTVPPLPPPPGPLLSTTTSPPPPPGPTDTTLTTRYVTPAASPLSTPGMLYASVIDTVRRWSLKYDGGKDPIGFIERVEELVEVYGLECNMMPRTMPELLRDGALMWFRNNNQHWHTWAAFRADFLAFFLPPRYFEDLDDDIRKRQQKARESFKDYVIAMQNMMRHANYTRERQLDRIFRNAHVDYQMYIRRKDFTNLDELIKMAEEYEGLRANHPEVSQNHRDNRQQASRRDDRTRQVVHNEQQVRINPRTACRRCGQDGHGFRFCQNPSVLFCWECGQLGIRTRDCCRRRSENSNGPRQQQGVTAAQNQQPLPQ